MIVGHLPSHGFTSRLANMPKPEPIRDDESGAYERLGLDIDYLLFLLRSLWISFGAYLVSPNSCEEALVPVARQLGTTWKSFPTLSFRFRPPYI